MQCVEAHELIDRCIDGELEPAREADLRSHAAGCAECARLINERMSLRDATSRLVGRHAAPEALRASIIASLDARERRGSTGRRAPSWAWLSLAACIALLGMTSWLILRPRGPQQIAFVHEAVSSHIRAMMASHLLDVVSTDQHTVKPWFSGKIDFAPAVADYAAKGFPLVGGRLDYLGDRPAAAIVYARNAHTINLFISPDPKATREGMRAADDRGFHTRSWSDGAMWYCAVSDVNDADLGSFAALVQSEHGSAETPEPSR